MLVGSKLVGWIGRKKNLDFLTASTRVQLKMGQEVSDAVTTPMEVGDTILKCLNRDPDWVAYHALELSEAAHIAPLEQSGAKCRGARAEGVQISASRTVRKSASGAGEYNRRQDISVRSAVLCMARGGGGAGRLSNGRTSLRDRSSRPRPSPTNNNHNPPRKRPHLHDAAGSRQAVAPQSSSAC